MCTPLFMTQSKCRRRSGLVLGAVAEEEAGTQARCLPCCNVCVCVFVIALQVVGLLDVAMAEAEGEGEGEAPLW